MHIALFGGSFDPPHLGHVWCATWARLVGRVDEVWILPVAKHPYAKPLQAWDRRWRLVQAAFADLPFIRLRDDEQRNSQGYTFDLIEALGRAHPGHRWSLVGGTDTARDLPNWHRGGELVHLVGIIPVPRRGFDDHPAALPAISSSSIRSLLATGASVTGLVPAAVEDLLRAEGWYAAGQPG